MSYIAVIASLAAMQIRASEEPSRRTEALAELKEGWGYASQSRPIRSLLLLLALVSLVRMPYTVLMPVFADRILHGGAHTLGFPIPGELTATASAAIPNALETDSRDHPNSAAAGFRNTPNVNTSRDPKLTNTPSAEAHATGHPG